MIFSRFHSIFRTLFLLEMTKFAENYRKSFSTCIQHITSQNRISKIRSITNGRACKNINQCKTADCFFALPKKSLKNDLKEFCMNFGKPFLYWILFCSHLKSAVELCALLLLAEFEFWPSISNQTCWYCRKNIFLIEQKNSKLNSAYVSIIIWDEFLKSEQVKRMTQICADIVDIIKLTSFPIFLN